MLGGVFPPVVAHLLADITEFSAKMGEAEAIAARVSGSGTVGLKKLGGEMMGVGGVMAAASGAVIAETLKMAAGFDTMMERVHTQAGASQSEVDGLKQKVLNLAMATGQGPEKLAEALYHVESVGYRGSTAMDVLTHSAKLAAISGANLDDTTYGLTSVMQTYGAKAGEAAKYAALFNATVGAGDMKMEAFNRAVGTGFYATARTFGIGIQSASGALAFLTDRGAHADEAATRLRMTIALLAAPSQKSTTILKGLGLTNEAVGKSFNSVGKVLGESHVTYSQLADDLKKPDGFYVALTHLHDALVKTGLSSSAANAQLSHAFGGGKSDSTILAMLNNLDNLKQKYEAVGHGMGSYAESYAASQKTATNQMERFKATAQALGIEIGHALMPYALTFLGWLRDVFTWMATHEGVVKMLAFLLGVTLVTGLGLLITGFVMLAAATVEVWGPILLGVIVVEAIVAAILWLWANWRQVWGWIVDKAKAVGAWLSKVWDEAKAKVVSVWNAILDWLKRVWNSIAQWFTTQWHTVTDPIGKAWKWITDTTSRVWNGILTFLKKWWPLLVIIFLPWLALIIGLWNHFHQQVFDTATSWWNNITGWLQTAWDWVVAKAKWAWNLVYEYVIAPIQRAYHAVTDWLGRMHKSTTGQFDSIMRWVRGAWNAFYGIVIDPVVRAAKAVGGFMHDLWLTITGWVKQTEASIRATAADWWQIGRSIVLGIINGVENMAHEAWQKVVDFANSLLQSAMSALGVNSPSKRFRDIIGKAIPEGVAVGVKAHAHLALGSVTELADGLVQTAKMAVKPSVIMPSVDSVTAAIRAASPNQQSHPPLPVTVNVQATVDGKVLFETQQEAALKYERRNNAPAFSAT